MPNPPTTAPWSKTSEGVLLHLHVQPGAKRTAFAGRYGDGAIKLAVAAPPVDGRANALVIKFLAELLDLPRSAIEIRSGESGRDKTVLLRGADPAKLSTITELS